MALCSKHHRQHHYPGRVGYRRRRRRSQWRRFQVADTGADVGFADNPLVVGDPNIRFYAGCPITAPDGSKLGTLCVIDRQPRQLSQLDVRALRDLAEMVEAEVAQAHTALTDELTGLSNRRGFGLFAQTVLGICARQRLEATLVYAGLEDFKQSTTASAPAKGDRAIREAAELLASTFRASDVVARVGGDGFCILLTGGGTADEKVRRPSFTFRLTSAWFGRSPGKSPVGTLFSRSTTALPERVPRYS